MLWPEFERFWDPWRELEDMRRALASTSFTARVKFPPVNVWAKEDSVVVTTEIAGTDKNSFDISVEGNILMLRGTRKPEELREGETYHRRERWHNSFTKTVRLPFTVEADRVEARYSKGVLSVVLPRAEAEKPRKIAIKSE